jgi:hypothetical protein
MKLHNLASSIKIRSHSVRRPRRFVVLLHEPPLVSFTASQVGHEAFSCFQAIYVLRVAPHQAATIAEDSDEFVDGTGGPHFVSYLVSH